MADAMNNSNNETLAQSVPPPPAEVKVRTMKSDIEGIAKSGGGSPQFRTVAVEGRGLRMSQLDAAGRTAPPATSSSSSGFPWWIVIVGVIVLVILLLFGYVLLLKK